MCGRYAGHSGWCSMRMAQGRCSRRACLWSSATSWERVATLKAALKRGQLRGRLADMYFAIEEDLRDVFLKDQLQAVHVTAFGLCVHDFKVAPCPKALNCVKQCRDFLHDTGDSGQRRALIQLEARGTLALDQAE